MPVQLLADHEEMVQVLHQCLLLLGKPCRVGRVYSGEVIALQLILLTADSDGSFLIVDVAEKVAVLHSPFGMLVIHLSLYLELHYGYGLMHLSC